MFLLLEHISTIKIAANWKYWKNVFKKLFETNMKNYFIIFLKSVWKQFLKNTWKPFLENLIKKIYS